MQAMNPGRQHDGWLLFLFLQWLEMKSLSGDAGGDPLTVYQSSHVHSYLDFVGIIATMTEDPTTSKECK